MLGCNSNFTYEHYTNILQELRKSYKFTSFKSATTNDVILRHDVDASLHAALKIAKIEKELDISSTFFILLPILLDRIYFNLSLIGHWLVLWAFYLSIKDLNKKKFNYKWILILTISSLTNFYFFIIVISIFSYSWIFNLNYQLIDKIKILCLNYFYCLLILYLSGFFEINVINYSTYGFGFYKSNLCLYTLLFF